MILNHMFTIIINSDIIGFKNAKVFEGKKTKRPNRLRWSKPKVWSKTYTDSGQKYLYFMKKTNNCLGYYSEVNWSPILIKMSPSKAEIKVIFLYYS